LGGICFFPLFAPAVILVVFLAIHSMPRKSTILKNGFLNPEDLEDNQRIRSEVIFGQAFFQGR